MAILSSSFELTRFDNSLSDFNSRNQWGLNLILEVRVLGCSRNPNLEFANSSKVVNLHHSIKNKQVFFRPKCAESEISIVSKDLGIDYVPKTDNRNSGDGGGGGGGDGGNGRFPTGGGGGGGGDGEEGDNDEDEFGAIMKFEDVMREIEMRGATLPSDMLEAAKTMGLRRLILTRYLDLQMLLENAPNNISIVNTFLCDPVSHVERANKLNFIIVEPDNKGSVWPLGFLMKYCAMLRNRMLADPSFLFKVGTEVVIDSCCATFAEVQKRGKDFWAEFELYAADLLVGVVVDIALVGMLAPYARIGKPSISSGLFGRVQHFCGALPSSVFEAERPGCKFSVKQRIATYFYKGVLYGSVGFGCGLIGQGIANMIMNAKRSIKKSEEDIPVPPLLKSAVLWGVFLAVSSNTRYQILNGLEQLVEASPMAKRVPPVAMAFTVGVRFANNIYGGMQFIDWAKWSGVQ